MEGIQLIQIGIIFFSAASIICLILLCQNPTEQINEEFIKKTPKKPRKYIVAGCFESIDILEILGIIHTNYITEHYYNGYYEDKISLEKFNALNETFKDDSIPQHNVEHSQLTKIDRSIADRP